MDFKSLLKNLCEVNNISEGELVEPLIKHDEQALKNLGLSETGVNLI